MKKTESEKPALMKKIRTYTKRAVTVILAVALVDMQLSYLLAFLGREEIAETLSSTIAEVIVGVMGGYFAKALLETFFEKREDRLCSELDITDEIEETADDEEAVG